MESMKRRLQDEELDSKLRRRALFGLENAILMGYLGRGSTFFKYESTPGMFKYGHLLVCTSQFECTDERDHVITIANLMKTLDSRQEQLSLRSLQNYSPTFAEVFVRMVRWFVIHEGYMLLRQVTPRPTTCGIRDSINEHPAMAAADGNDSRCAIPSWAYLLPYSGGNLVSGFDPTHPISVYARTKRLRLALSRLATLGNRGFSSDGKLLLARGRRVAVVGHMHFAFDSPDGIRICRESPQPSDKNLERHGGNFVIVKPDHTDDQVDSTLVMASDTLSEFATQIQYQVELGVRGIENNPWKRERLRCPAIQGARTSYCGSTRRIAREKTWDLSQLKRRWQSRKFCLLSGVEITPAEYGVRVRKWKANGDPDRRMALVPPHTTLGDVVLSFEGCVTLFASRPCGHGHWNLLGEATMADFIGAENHYTVEFVNETFEVC
jgi:hypothetical protein